ncbi:hypothetical protein X747_14415 [Mesorhizobium sp. LNJC384A00]|uniref:M28 family peptidase n=1 Tax=Mesorhizobium sp. LNJC384A00 TaxID=1287268 RepID=UPI0003CDEC6C|nr:M28 family peptidase [Mesorhizobium sp. LNJC384A00]ESY41999.1 hypothetical protein X747_14415 [Mesorhizobium sp. LNJC384A00]
MTHRASDIQTILQMFSYMRPSGSAAETAFVERYLTPLGFQRDEFKNLYLQIGASPSILWSSHMDTVHSVSGTQTLSLKDGILSLSRKSKKGASSCLGADDTAGVWLMTEMVKAGIEGLYVIHHAEERGCIGSSNLVQHNSKFVAGIQAAIAFDRRGYDSVITHQSWGRTASDAFANSLAAILGGDYKPDDTGTYTDTNEYAGIIPECTNISVGYYDQHTRRETQNVEFLLDLRDTLLAADWSQLVIERDPQSDPYEDAGWDSVDYGYSSRTRGYSSSTSLSSKGLTVEYLVKQYPDIVADILEGQGWDAEHLHAEIGAYYGGHFDDDQNERNAA